jgi:colicin import membrane protein
MVRDRYNVIPVSFAGILHLAIFATMIFAFHFSPPARPAVPLAIKGTLVSEEQIRQPPPEPEPQPELEPEPEPDNSEQERLEAEERKRQEDLRIEQERIARLKKRQQEEAAEKKRREEAELERQRQQAEKKRLEDVKRQEEENERKRREAEEAERQRQLDRELAEEEARLAAMNSGAQERYAYALEQAIQRKWIRPPTARPGLECIVNVRQLPGGEVVSATIGRCNGDDAVRRSIEAAVFKASPLPEPEEPTLFDRNLRITFKPEQ